MNTLSVIGLGSMGSAVAGRLVRGGAQVLTSLVGRSPESCARAKAENITEASDEDILGSDYILSIVPPAEAYAVAQYWANKIAPSHLKPVYIDCNAISSELTLKIAEIFKSIGVRYIDAGIIGGPGTHHTAGPNVYFSGEEPSDIEKIKQYGLQVLTANGPIGAASALKMTYAGLNKGIVGLAAAMILQASQHGSAKALLSELEHSQPQLLALFKKSLPQMYSKAWRWEFEMQQIAEFSKDNAHIASLYESMGGFYAELGIDWTKSKALSTLIDDFFKA
jgi:3-hydroxyisobutyrate dehydrogenase-like beta-hydroxyacid dehydrogenase